MFKFNAALYNIKQVQLKAISKSTIEPRITFVDENGTEFKMALPVAVARRIKNRLNGISKFVSYYPAAVGLYDNRIVAVDVPDGQEYKVYRDTGEWKSKLFKNSEVLDVLDSSWSYDGQYVYKHDGPVEQLGDTMFGFQGVQVYNLYSFGETKGDDLGKMACLAYWNRRAKQWAVTIPVTKSSGSFLQLTGDADEFHRNDTFAAVGSELARMDRNVFPNLRFVNYAAKSISNTFSYETIEPLGLPLLMIEHRTFNLGSLTTPVQASSPALFKFTEALAWMIGLNGQVQNMDQLLAVKGTIKMLLTKGNTYNGANEGEAAQGKTTKQMIEETRSVTSNMELLDLTMELNVVDMDDLVENFVDEDDE